jgi:SAM-dependent methyltransferase
MTSDAGEAALDRFAPYYDLEYDDYDADLAFYLRYAAAATPTARAARILELACGTGRVLCALAAQGYFGLGVDASPAMLARARERAARLGLTAVAWQEARMEALPAGLGPFDVALCALNSFAYLTRQADQLAMLRGAHAALAPGGALLLDLTPVDADGPFPASGEVILQASWPLPHGGRVTKLVSGQWDPAEQQQQVHWIYDEEDAEGRVRRTTIPQTLRYTYRWEAGLLLERAGFAAPEVFGGYDFEPYDAGSARLILVAQRPPAGG